LSDNGKTAEEAGNGEQDSRQVDQSIVLPKSSDISKVIADDHQDRSYADVYDDSAVEPADWKVLCEKEQRILSLDNMGQHTLSFLLGHRYSRPLHPA
jgi:hypothetical protein